MKNILSVDSVELSNIQLLSFRLNKGWDWLKVSFDDLRGLIQIESSYGSYSFIWGSMGKGETLKSFFVRADKYYLSGKLWHNSHREKEEFNYHEACKDLKNAILRDRRRSGIDRDEARSLFEEACDLAKYPESDSLESFCRSYGESKELSEWDSEPYDKNYGMRPIARFLMLRDELIPLIKEEFRKLI